MRFSVNEVFDSLEIAFDIKKVAFVYIGALIAVFGAALILWLGNITGNLIVSIIFQLIAVIFFYIVFVVVSGGISITNYKELTSGEKLSIKQALSYCKENIVSLFASPLLLIISIAAVAGIEYIIFLLGRHSIGQIVLSIFSAPILILNIALILMLIFGLLMIFEIIAVDASSPVGTIKKIHTIIRKAPLQVIMYFAPVMVIGMLVVVSIVGIFFGALLLTLTLVGSASGIFAEMAAADVASFSLHTQIAWTIFSIFASILGGLILSFPFVFIKACALSIYLAIKERI